MAKINMATKSWDQAFTAEEKRAAKRIFNEIGSQRIDDASRFHRIPCQATEDTICCTLFLCSFKVIYWPKSILACLSVQNKSWLIQIIKSRLDSLKVILLARVRFQNSQKLCSVYKERSFSIFQSWSCHLPIHPFKKGLIDIFKEDSDNWCCPSFSKRRIPISNYLQLIFTNWISSQHQHHLPRKKPCLLPN